MVIFVYYSFKVDVDRQDHILEEIRQTQAIGNDNNRKLIDLETSNTELRETNKKLVRTVCLLQSQVESLGATPLVDTKENCEDNIIPK